MNIFFNKFCNLKFEIDNIFSEVYQIDDVNENDVAAIISRLFCLPNHEESSFL